MNWLIKGSQAAGILLTVAGIIAGIYAFINPSYEFASIPTAVILIITGVIVFAISKFTYNMVKDLPKPPTLKESTAGISSAADMMKQMNKMNKLSANGIPVKVKILGFKDSGQLVNYDPVIEFQLEVLKEHKYDNYYINSHKQIVSKILTGRIETGKEYFAKVDPEDKNSIFVTFS